MEIYDIHTHQILLEDTDDPYHSCILDVYPLEFEVVKEAYLRHSFSCGIHPWYSEESEDQIEYLGEIASNERIVAIGETGLDKLKGPDFEIQIPVFTAHIKLSEKLHKPLIIHCVKAWEELIRVRREAKPTQPWIIHGYRGKPALTEQLLREGFLFSIGDTFNADSLLLIPLESMFCETDEGEMDIREVYLRIANVLGMEIENFVDKIAHNVRRIFPAVECPKPLCKFELEEEGED